MFAIALFERDPNEIEYILAMMQDVEQEAVLKISIHIIWVEYQRQRFIDTPKNSKVIHLILEDMKARLHSSFFHDWEVHIPIEVLSLFILDVVSFWEDVDLSMFLLRDSIFVSVCENMLFFAKDYPDKRYLSQYFVGA